MLPWLTEKTEVARSRSPCPSLLVLALSSSLDSARVVFAGDGKTTIMRNGPLVSRANCGARDIQGDSMMGDDESSAPSRTATRLRPATVSFSREFYLLSNRYFHRLNAAEFTFWHGTACKLLSLLTAASSRRGNGLEKFRLPQRDRAWESVRNLNPFETDFLLCSPIPTIEVYNTNILQRNFGFIQKYTRFFF